MPDAAVQAVLGSVIMVAITVIVTASFALFLITMSPAPDDPVNADISVTAHIGTFEWGTSDEVLTVKHAGGENLLHAPLRIQVWLGNDLTTYCDAGCDELLFDPANGIDVEGAFTDGVFSIGERWVLDPMTIPDEEALRVEVVYTAGAGQIVSATTIKSGKQPCLDDVFPPTPLSLDLISPNNGNLTVLNGTATAMVRVAAADDCIGLDLAAHPTLSYRIDGSAWTDVGPMTPTGSGVWEAEIVGVTWGAYPGGLLEYKVKGLTDLRGNVDATGDGHIREELIDRVFRFVSSWSRLDPPNKGRVVSFANAQSASDGGLAMTVREEGNVSVFTSVLSPTTFSSSAAVLNANYAMVENDSRANVTSLDEYVRVSGFSFSEPGANIEEVTLCFDGHWVQQTAGGTHDNDRVELGYYISGAFGASDKFAQPPAPDETKCKAFTKDPVWTVDDIANLEVEAKYILGKKTKGKDDTVEDPIDLHVDALWVEVKYNITSDYSARVQFNIDSLPIDATNPYSYLLNLSYSLESQSTERYFLDIWNASLNAGMGGWENTTLKLNGQGAPTKELVLDADHIDPSGVVKLRLRDRDPQLESTAGIDIDYIRVEVIA